MESCIGPPAAALALAALAVAAGGCIATHPLGEGELARYTTLAAGSADLGPPVAPSLGERRLPARWVLRQRASVLWSAISLVRASDRLKAGADEIELVISPAHAVALADVLAQARLALEEVAEVSRLDRAVDRRRWAAGLAAALGRVETVSRLAAPEAAEGEEPLGLAAGPLLELVASYLNEQAGGGLLGDLDPAETDRLRAALAQAVLRLGFAAAGKRDPEGLGEAVQQAMRGSRDLAALQQRLAAMIEEHLDRAPPEAGTGLGETVRSVLAYAPKALGALEKFARQWDRMDRIEIALHEVDGEPAVAAIVAVLPGREVRLDRMVMFQPALVLRGTSRIVVLPRLAGTGETAIAFEPAGEGGGVDLRFEGAVYALAKALVLPLADGALRELRVFVRTPSEGEQVVHVALVMEATGAKGDPRRLIHFQDVRQKRLVRGPFGTGSVVEGKELVFNYLTPERRYTFQHVRAAGD